MAQTRQDILRCAWCGRIFASPRSESRILNDERVCRRPCTLRPIYDGEEGRAGPIRWTGEHVILTSKEVEVLQELLGEDGEGLIGKMSRDGRLSRALTSALKKLGKGFAPSRSPVTFMVVQETKTRWTVRFIKPYAGSNR